MKKINIESIHEGDRLTTKELYTRLGISDKTWKTNKKDILIEIGKVFEYEVEYKGRSIIYCFNKQVGIPKASRDKIYEDAILETLYFQPLNTAKNVSRIIQKENEDIKELGYSEGTNYEYTKIRMRKWFGVDVNDTGDFNNMEDLKERKGYIERKVWCMLDSEYNDYVEMSQEQISFFVECVKDSFKDDSEVELKLLSDFDSGLITESEMKESLGILKTAGYAAAKKQFKEKYGKFPIKVPYYTIYKNKLPKELREELEAV